MSGILDQIRESVDHFGPANVVQFTVLQIARRLNDTLRLYEYLRAAESHGLVFLVEAYKGASKDGSDFFVHLKKISSIGQ
jgi:hypothetical protein